MGENYGSQCFAITLPVLHLRLGLYAAAHAELSMLLQALDLRPLRGGIPATTGLSNALLHRCSTGSSRKNQQ